MKVSIVGPGIMPIPPKGWGAVEILIWDQKLALEKLGHEVDIVNTQSPVEILSQVNNLKAQLKLLKLIKLAFFFVIILKSSKSLSFLAGRVRFCLTSGRRSGPVRGYI